MQTKIELPPTRHRVSGPAARYFVLRYARNVKTLYEIDIDLSTQVEVVGDPDNGGYEWLIRRDGVVVEHSDVGYGSAAAALRDGLNAQYASEFPEEKGLAGRP